MTICEQTRKYIDAVEHFAGKKFQFSNELCILVQLAESNQMNQKFEEITFFAKFISSAYSILHRNPPQSEETRKLSTEFNEKLEKIHIILRELIEEAPQDIRATFIEKFLPLSHEGMKNLLAFLYELSWIKNYTLDNKTGR